MKRFAIIMSSTIGICIALPFVLHIGRPNYHIQTIGDKEKDTYWAEYRPTTFHGMCAHTYQGVRTQGIIELMEGVNPKTHGSVRTRIGLYPTFQQANTEAEAHCPTHWWKKAKPIDLGDYEVISDGEGNYRYLHSGISVGTP